MEGPALVIRGFQQVVHETLEVYLSEARPLTSSLVSIVRPGKVNQIASGKIGGGSPDSLFPGAFGHMVPSHLDTGRAGGHAVVATTRGKKFNRQVWLQ